MRQERNPCVYILASKHYGTLYIGVTSDLLGRMWQHRNAATPGFTSKYANYRLVHFEMFGDMYNAIARENPEWRDLAVSIGLPPIAPAKPRNGP
jgi:putative endonuclease